MHKTAAQRQSANVSLYDWVRHDFTWAHAHDWLAGLPHGSGVNIGHEAVDRHAAGPERDKTAVLALGQHGVIADLSYGMLLRQTNRFANVLEQLRLPTRSAVPTLLGPDPHLWIAALGTLRRGNIHYPLSPTLDPSTLRDHLHRAGARILVTNNDLYRRLVAPHRATLPALVHVLVTDDDRPAPGTTRLAERLASAGEGFIARQTAPDDPAMVILTRGTTGPPKATVHVHNAVAAQHATAVFSLDLRPDDVYMCTADPAGITGTAYGLIAPLSVGATAVVDTAAPTATRRFGALAEYGVSVYYTEPGVLREMREHDDMAPWYDLSALRHIASTGAPLDNDTVGWANDVLGHPIHDTWSQAETGAIMIGNYGGVDIRAGAMGLPEPGVNAVVLECDGDDQLPLLDGPPRRAPDDADGILALRAGWPSMFRGYLGGAAAAAFTTGGWYLTGDIVRRDPDGYYRFVRRAAGAKR